MSAEILKLDPLRNIDFTALDYETLQQELINYVQANYAARGIQDDFLDSNAGKMMMDMLAYFGNILAFRADTLANEAYLPTTIRRQNIINILNLVGETIRTPQAASVLLTVVPENIPTSSIIIPARYRINTTGADGQPAVFEILKSADDYWTNLEIPPGVNLYNVHAYEGQFRYEYFQSNGLANQKYKLTFSPVIWESVQVAVSPVAPDKISAEEIEANKVTKVLSLVDPSVETIIYKESFDKNNIATLTFANETFGRIPPTGHYVYMMYRTGGGERGNIAEGTINDTTSFVDVVGTPSRVTIINSDTRGEGGANQESIDEAKESVPLRVRTVYKLVTVEDYATLLRQYPGIRDVDVLDYNTDRSINASPTVPQNSVYIWVYPKEGDVLQDDFRQQIMTFLEERRLVAIDHQLFTPVYIDWNLDAIVHYDQFTNPSDIDALIKDALIEEFSGDNVRFGREIRKSKIIATIQNISGVVYVELTEPTGDIIPSRNGEIARLLEPNIELDYIKKVV